MKSLALIILLCCTAMGMAQDPVLNLDATLRDDDTGKKLIGATLEVYQEGKLFASKTSDSLGKVPVIDLPLNFDYTLYFKKEGFVSKVANIDASHDYPEDLTPTLNFDMQISLFRKVDNRDFNWLETTPMINFSLDENGYQNWDKNYTRKMLKTLDFVKRGYSFELVMSYFNKQDLAEQYYLTANLDSAILFYHQATNILPTEAKPKDRMAQLARIKEELTWNAEQCYAKGLFEKANKNYEMAINYLRMTLALDIENVDADDSLSVCYRAFWENEGAKKKDMRLFNQNLNWAQNSFEEEAYEKAIEYFQIAAKLKGTQAYPILMIRRCLDLLKKEE